MGKQIRFFMSNADELEFCKAVSTLEGQLVTEDFFEINSGFLTENQPRKVYIKFPTSQIIVGNSGRIDVLSSGVIEFVTCISLADSMNYGRLWIQTNESNTKEKWLSAKYNNSSKWIRKTYKINIDKDFYIADDAFKLYESGVRMMATPNTECKFN
ncbi:hypothetical protein SAMN04487897_1656 [Paenibacillus sp. yr247]|uniref:hypothetical protein n=1 Tax=Paenibacillus sp. yr247 TaxID=1761880 RepID=UPI0008829E1E|nr:hypothetical protein [Paenibacillus sp. yr247]SDP28677.1 hypothetical protein SAMN04487897_1656 [Paenibacillus sp. yr247]